MDQNSGLRRDGKKWWSLVGFSVWFGVSGLAGCSEDTSPGDGTDGEGGEAGSGNGGNSLRTGGSGGEVASGGASSGGGGITGGHAGDGGSGGDAASGGASSGIGGAMMGGDTGSGGSTATMVGPFDCADPPWDDAAFDDVYEVGEGKEYVSPSDVPWESLDAGSLVKIHHRVEPYRDKWVLNVSGTQDQPVVVLGVPNQSGALPIISGENATTRSQLDFWTEARAVIKIGGSSVPDNAAPSHVYVDCLEITGAHANHEFTDHEGTTQSYADNAAAITIESGSHIFVRNSILRGNGNGLFSAWESSSVTVSGNHIHDNGNQGSIFEHNSYTESDGIVFEFNRYGPLCQGCDGNNLKDRSAGTVVRYNWIEGGNRQLDLVDSEYSELSGRASYSETFVYGNILTEPDGAGNSQVIHYGGDSGDLTTYRKGTLFFFHNTVVSTRTGNTTLVRLSSEDESLRAENNVIFTTEGGSLLAILDGAGDAVLEENWLPTGWRWSHGSTSGTTTETGTLEGAAPGFVDAGNQDFSLTSDSPAVDSAGELGAALVEHPLDLQYELHRSAAVRPGGDVPDRGAFER